MNKVICVFGSSSNAIDRVYFEAAERLGREIAGRGDRLLFGGGLTGLMGECARAVHRSGGTVIGVIPEALNEKGIVYEDCDELIVTPDMRARKARMDERSDAFVALPGGFGTIEEIMEAITLKQLGYHDKPIAILNVAGYYGPLLEQFEEIMGKRFAKPACSGLYLVTEDVSLALDYIDGYTPAGSRERWLTDMEHPGPRGERRGRCAMPADFEYCKIEVYIPKTHLEPVRRALQSVDAGHIGNYDSCLSYQETVGCWRPLPGSNPYEGEENVVCSAEEYKVEVICRRDRVDETIGAIKAAHPYEVPVINAIPLYRTGF